MEPEAVLPGGGETPELPRQQTRHVHRADAEVLAGLSSTEYYYWVLLSSTYLILVDGVVSQGSVGQQRDVFILLRVPHTGHTLHQHNQTCGEETSDNGDDNKTLAYAYPLLRLKILQIG